MKVLDENTSDGLGRLNQAVKVASGGYFKTVNEAMAQMVADCKTAGNANTFLKNYCGIDLSNGDTGAITGKDAGGTSVKTKSSIVSESGSLDTSFSANKFTTSNGLTVKLSSSFSSLKTNTKKYIWRGLKSWWMESALNLIKESYGENFGFGANATVKEISVDFYSANDGMLASVGTLSNTTGQTGKLVLSINTYYFNVSDTSDSDGKATIFGEEYYLDRTLAHEMTHAVMAANISSYAGLPKCIREGMAELTHRIDDDRKSGIQKLAGNSELLKKSLKISTDLQNAVSITQNKKTVTVDNPDYVAGYMFLRYLAKQGAENGSYSESEELDINGKNLTVKDNLAQRGATVKSGVLTVDKNFEDDLINLAEYSSKVKKVNATKLTTKFTIIGNSANNSIKAGSGADTISANVGNDTVYGGSGNDVIYGDAGNDKIFGEKGNDTLYGGSGKNTLSGGDGNDVFVYSGGNDVITDYTAGQDKIKISSGKISKTTYSGKNVIFKIGNGTLTVQNGKGKKITITDSNNKTTTKKYKTAEIFEDNNFITDALNLDSITDEKYSVQNIESQNNFNLTEDKILLTYTEK